LIADLNPTIAHNVGMITRHFGNLESANIKNPKVKMVVGQGNPSPIVMFKNLKKLFLNK